MLIYANKWVIFFYQKVEKIYLKKDPLKSLMMQKKGSINTHDVNDESHVLLIQV